MKDLEVRTFQRGGKVLPLGGLFLVLAGLAYAARCVQLGIVYDLKPLACYSFLIIFGTLMMVLFNVVSIDPRNKVVKITSGFRLTPKTTIHPWSEYESVVAFEPSGFNKSRSSYSLYLRNKETKELEILVQQYNDLEKMHQVARDLSNLMGIPAVRSYSDEETPLPTI